jgi:uncharacterized SAM-binding protein YcdF (DUF218 family)
MRGVEKKQIHLENKARFTRQNLLFSSRIVQGLKREAKGEGSTTLRIGIITGGFHIRRTMLLEEEVGAFAGESVEFFPAYSPMTQQDNWIDDPEGRELVLTELRKTLMVERAGKGCRKEISATSRG